MALATISSTGTKQTSSAQNDKTVSCVSSAIGNYVVIGAVIESTSISTSSISGGGVGTWTLLAGHLNSGASRFSLWGGKTTSIGTNTATLVTSGAVTSIWVDLISQEFTCTGVSSATTWAQNGAGGTKTNTSSTSVTFPTMIPTVASCAYIGFGINSGTGVTTGQTAGYTVVLDAIDGPLLWKGNLPDLTPQTPTSVQSPSNTSWTIAALLTATNPDVARPGQFLPFFNHHDDELQQRPSGLYVQRKVFGFRAPTRDRVLARVSR